MKNILKVGHGQKTNLRRYKSLLKGRKPGLLVNFVNCLHCGSGFSFLAFFLNMDPDPGSQTNRDPWIRIRILVVGTVLQSLHKKYCTLSRSRNTPMITKV